MGNIVMPLWAECPPATRMLCAGPPLLSLALMLAEASGLGWLVGAMFNCSLHNVLQRFFIWTLCLGPFYSPVASGMAFLMIIFTVYMVMIYVPRQEKDMGSTTFLLWVLLMNTLTNLVYLPIMYCLYLYYQHTLYGSMYFYVGYQGIWPLVIVIMTLQSLSNPDGSTSFWGLVQIPNKWYPIALVAFFSLLSMRVMWDFVAALVIGYAHDRLRLYRLLPSKVRVSQLEQKIGSAGGQCSLLGSSWVPATHTAAFEVETGDRRYATLSDFGRGGGQQLSTLRSSGAAAESSAPAGGGGGGTGAGFQAFSGAGNRLGETNDVERGQVPKEEEMRLSTPSTAAPSPSA